MYTYVHNSPSVRLRSIHFIMFYLKKKKSLENQKTVPRVGEEQERMFEKRKVVEDLEWQWGGRSLDCVLQLW